MHFYLYNAVSPASLASSALDIETESSGFIAPYARFRRSGKKFSDICKNTGICSGIGTGGSADGRLIDTDDFVDMLKAHYAVVGACRYPGMVELPGKNAVKGFQNKARFSRARHTGNTDKTTHGKFHIDIF